MNHLPFIYLASQSPRRRQLLEQLRIPYELLLPGAAEDVESLEAVSPQEAPLGYVERVTRLKLDVAIQRLKATQWTAAPILCADTTVAFNDKILGKPKDHVDVQSMLQLLAGNTHEVLTCMAIADVMGNTYQVTQTSYVTFAPLSTDEIARYVQSNESMGKAGGYAVQGLAAAFISRIEGSYSGIMGLALYELTELLQQLPLQK